ncbi:hypothetical protein CTAYLR_004715 [Chrysophaeum taylorii]|uniref:Semialdehyde dehydrogenase NAD-binding domain-containing protein n=1 Tax=Chrysophaeum taylorii TaxID=2483200 RepID=A0AAD7XIS2_9STRA|nr:hypothetical protein CTAYLR_004715 [Chrysophaeum taylorii]
MSLVVALLSVDALVLDSRVPKKTVAVVGASGNVGKLVTRRLLDEGHAVRAVVRTPQSADRLAAFLDDATPEVRVADIADPGSDLEAALGGVAAVVVCTGTTAFPTTAWAGGDVGVDDVPRVVLATWWECGFDVRATIDKLSERGMQTPDVVDAVGVERLAAALGDDLDHVVLMSSLGVTRRTAFPFTILNAAGVLDAKARGEAAVVCAARARGAAFTILRPGQLFGPPYDNDTYLGTIAKLDKDLGTRAVAIAKGDDAAGDTLRSTLADVIVQALHTPAVRNTDFTVLTVKGPSPSKNDLAAQLEAALA